MDRVLLIEDDDIIGEMVSMYLIEESFLVLRTHNGHDGLAALHEFEPDLILLDLMLPDFEGTNLCNSLRSLTPVPIIIISSNSKVSEKIEAFTVGADDYICKPFSMHEMEKRMFYVRGETIDMTFSEFELIRLLYGHPERVYRREDLINALRGFDSYINDRAIDVHITNLRRNIEINPKEPKFIKTVWGVGYKFVL